MFSKSLIVIVAAMLFASSNARAEPKTTCVETTTDASASFEVTVDYKTPSFKELNEAFDWVDPSFEKAVFKKFGDQTPRKIVFEYLQFNKPISSNQVFLEADKRNLRPATFEELVAFAAAYPLEQRKFPIVALSSVAQVDGNPSVAFLGQGDDGRGLDLLWAGNDWFVHIRFLVARK